MKSALFKLAGRIGSLPGGHRASTMSCAHGLAAIVLAGLSTFSAAQGGGIGEIWICVDAETGAKTFTSNPRGLRNCHRADPNAKASNTRPAVAAASPSAAGTKSAANTVARAPTVLLSSEQRQRESDRKQILQDELASENKKFAELQREYNQGTPLRLPGETDDVKYRDRKQRIGQDVERSRVNIRSLERELERL